MEAIGMSRLPQEVKDALIERMNALYPGYKGDSGPIDVDGLLEAVLDDLASSNPTVFETLREAAPFFVAKELYQRVQRGLRQSARGDKWRMELGENNVNESQLTPAEKELRGQAPSMLATWVKSLTPELLSRQYSFRDGPRTFAYREYGDLNIPEMHKLEDKYEAEARSKQAQADLLRNNRQMFAQAQQTYFGKIDTEMSLRTFLGKQPEAAA